MARGACELHGSERAAGTLYESFDQKNKKRGSGILYFENTPPLVSVLH